MKTTSKKLMTRRSALALLGAGVPIALGATAVFAHEERRYYGGHMHGEGHHHGHDDDHHHGRGHHHDFGDAGGHRGYDHRHSDDDHGPRHHGERWRKNDGKKS